MNARSALDVLNSPHDAVISVPATVVWTRPHATRPTDEAVLGDDPDLQRWADDLDDTLRFDLHGRVDTQALLGEPVIVLEVGAGWAAVELPLQPTAAGHGHRGWIPARHLTRHNVPLAEHHAVLSGARWTSPRQRMPPLSYGTILPIVANDEGTVRLLLPDGKRVDVLRTMVTPLVGDAPWQPAALLTAAGTFAGTPYLWGGLSGAGVDCSGLVHLSARAQGAVVPRDANEQAAAAPTRPLRSAAPGDLVFFANDYGIHHVAIATGSHSGIFHAPRTGFPVGYGDWSTGYDGDTLIVAS